MLFRSILQSLLQGADSRQLAKMHVQGQDGKAAYAKLAALHDGRGEVAKRLEAARQDLKLMSYHDEGTLPFTNLVTKLKGCFATLDGGGEGKTEREKVSILCDTLESVTNAKAIASAEGARKDHATNFDEAASAIGCVISRVFGIKKGIARSAMATKRGSDEISGNGDAWDDCDPRT